MSFFTIPTVAAPDEPQVIGTVGDIWNRYRDENRQDGWYIVTSDGAEYLMVDWVYLSAVKDVIPLGEVLLVDCDGDLTRIRTDVEVVFHSRAVIRPEVIPPQRILDMM